jgi:general secretion pathway protein J
MALLVILVGTLYATYFSFMRGRDIATADMEERREMAGTLDLLRKELSAAVYRSGNPALSFVVEDRDIFGKPASNLIFTAAGSGDQPEGYGDLVRLGYRTGEKEKTMSLARSERDAYRGTDPPVSYPQVEKIGGFLVECLDNGKWVRTWDTALKPALPEAVRVTITPAAGAKTPELSAIIRLRTGGT